MAVGYAEDANVQCCRFAQAMPLTETTGLFFFTQKNVNFSFGSENAQRTCVRDYTINYDTQTVAFSATRVIEQPAQWATGLGYTSEPYALRLTQGPNAGRIILITRTNDNADQRMTGGDPVIYNFYARHSDDDGVTWSSKSLCVAHDGSNYASAGQLLELPSGRLVYPIYKGGGGIGAIYSDDHGATWTRSAIVVDTTRVWTEPSMFRKDDGTLIALVRSDTNNTNLERGQFSSADNGESWTFDGINTAAAFKNSNTCLIKDGSLIIAGSTANPVYYQRVKYRFLTSQDNAATFPNSWGPFDDKQGTGYSHIAKPKADTYVVGYETFSPQTASTPDGDINSRNNVLIAVFNRSAIGAAAAANDLVAQTAQQIYDAYAARVVADGGTVRSPARCLSAIEAAISGGYWTQSGLAYSPNWGCKVDGSNQITKLYDLIGTNDASPILPLLDTASYSWAAMNFSTTSRYLITPSVQMDTNGRFALCIAGAGPSGTQFTSGFEGASLTTVPGAIRLRAAGEVTTSVVSAFTTGGVALGAYNVAQPAVGTGMCFFGESRVGRFSWIANGVTQQVQLVGGLMAQGVSRRISVNRLTDTSSNINSASTGRVFEVWHLNNPTRTTAKQLSADQGARYV